MRDLSVILEAELRELAANDRRRACPDLAGPSRSHPTGTPAPLVSFSSNDYLGLAAHPDLARAATASAARDGFGAGAARLVSGTLPAHRDLETTLATLLARPAALTFPSGYQANIGVVTSLAGRGDLIVSDAANHASLIDGCRLSGAEIAVYPHADIDAAKRALSDTGAFRRRLLVSESVFSMDGDVAPLAILAELADTYDAILVVDEAHALGVVGPGGRGVAAQNGVEPDVVVGTLGKAFGAAGGFATGSRALCDYLVNRARTFVFTTAQPPALAAAAEAGVRLALGPVGEERRARLDANRRHLVARMDGRIEVPPAAILPVIVGTNARALEASATLRRGGLVVPAIRPPTVPPGTARLRVTLSSEHSFEDVERLADGLLEVLS